MKNTEINIRDPFVLVEDGPYYMYGTRAATCWGAADGFDCYVSKDMDDWADLSKCSINRRTSGQIGTAGLRKCTSTGDFIICLQPLRTAAFMGELRS